MLQQKIPPLIFRRFEHKTGSGGGSGDGGGSGGYFCIKRKERILPRTDCKLHLFSHKEK